MNAEQIASVAAMVVLLTQLAKWSGLPLRFGPLVVALLSAIGVGLWAYSLGPLARAEVWGYAVAWVTVAASAAGVFGFTRAGAEQLTRVGRPKIDIDQELAG
jgi:hypothetical protein